MTRLPPLCKLRKNSCSALSLRCVVVTTRSGSQTEGCCRTKLTTDSKTVPNQMTLSRRESYKVGDGLVHDPDRELIEVLRSRRSPTLINKRWCINVLNDVAGMVMKL